MQILHFRDLFSRYRSQFLFAIAIIAGILVGLSPFEFMHSFATFISDTFIRIFKTLSLPIIALSLIVTLANLGSDASTKKIWQKTLIYTFGTTIFASFVAFILYIIVKPVNINSIGVLKEEFVQKSSYAEHLSNIVPSNLLRPFLEYQVMGVLLISLVVGIAIRFIPDNIAQSTVKSFFNGIHSLFLVITKWVVAIIPIALFGFVATTVLEMQKGIEFKGIGQYLFIVVAANLIQGFIVLPIWLKWNKIEVKQTMKGMLPALSLAFFSKSSAGTLPVTISSSEKNLNVSPKVSRFVLPLCTSINMNGCAAFIFITVVFLMQNHGIELSLPSLFLWIIISTLAAVGNAGVPMGCFFLSASLLASMNVPIGLLGIILPFYGIIDMIETSLNVWSDSCVARVVDKKIKSQPENSFSS